MIKLNNPFTKTFTVLLVLILVFIIFSDAVGNKSNPLDNHSHKEAKADVITSLDRKEANIYPTQAHPSAAIYQAEEASLTGGAWKATNHTGFTGTGFVAGYDNNANASTKFKVNAPASGEYFISLRYSAGDVSGWPKDRTVGFRINEGTLQKITLTGTEASWNTWSEWIQKVSLKSGVNTVEFKCITGSDNSDCINLDKLSVWAYHDNPTINSVTFSSAEYLVGEGNTVQSQTYAVNSNGIQSKNTAPAVYSSSNTSIATVGKTTGLITGVSPGTATISVVCNGYKAVTKITVAANPTITVDFATVERAVDPSMFGYILTPNYDVPDSRMTLLGPLLNRETIPAQNFQAISDLNGGYYVYEGSILPRVLEAYSRAKSNNLKWYMLMGMNPSWATASGNPMDTTENKPLKDEIELARFKQYIKDVLQYMKDNGAKPDFADLTNEYWTGTEKTFRAVWEAVREVYPEDIPAVGPGGVGFNGIPDFYIPYSSANKITIEGPSWHAFWTSDRYVTLSQLKNWSNKIADYQMKYPETNGKYIIWEENNAGSKDPTDWTRSMANVIRTGVTQNIKGCLEGNNWNGMSDLLTTNVNQQNPAARRPIWWVYYMFGQMSGNYVNVTTDGNEDFTAAACTDGNESKVVFAKNDVAGSVNLTLNHLPYQGKEVIVDVYKITSTENSGLEYQYSLSQKQASTKTMKLKIDKVGANESWMVIIKLKKSAPSFLYPMTPDDGDVVTAMPILFWSKSQGAESYTVTLSKNKDLSNPIFTKSGIMKTSYQVETKLTNGQKYYWSVTAKNSYGKTEVAYQTKYCIIVEKTDKVPGQFGPYLPSINAQNEAINPELTWSTAYKANLYRVVVSKNKDLSNPVVDVNGINNVRGTSQFGPNSQAYYKLAKSLDYNTTYYWMVYAVNKFGERAMNGPVHSFTTKAKGDAPTRFQLLSPKNGKPGVSARAELSWQASANAFFYQLEVSKNADMSNPVIVRDRMIYHKYTVEPNLLEPNTTYYWRVTALTKNLKYSTKASNDIFTFKTEEAPCSPLLYAQKGTDKQVTLWFHTSKGANSYEIMYGTKPGQYTKTLTGIKNSPYIVKGLKNDVTYYFAVVAVNKKGKSSVWNERSAIPSAN